MSNAERQARWRARHAAELAKLRKTAAIPPQPDKDAQIAALTARVRDLEAQLARAAKAAQAPPKPPPSDDARLAACQEKNRNLNAKMKALAASFAAKTEKVNAAARALHAARGVVEMCLYPDQRPRYLTPEDAARFDDACRQMNELRDAAKRQRPVT